MTRGLTRVAMDTPAPGHPRARAPDRPVARAGRHDGTAGPQLSTALPLPSCAHPYAPAGTQATLPMLTGPCWITTAFRAMCKRSLPAPVTARAAAAPTRRTSGIGWWRVPMPSWHACRDAPKAMPSGAGAGRPAALHAAAHRRRAGRRGARGSVFPGWLAGWRLSLESLVPAASPLCRWPGADRAPHSPILRWRSAVARPGPASSLAATPACCGPVRSAQRRWLERFRRQWPPGVARLGGPLPLPGWRHFPGAALGGGSRVSGQASTSIIRAAALSRSGAETSGCGASGLKGGPTLRT